MTYCKRISSIALNAVLCSQLVFGADLSPAKWPPAEKAQAEQAEMIPWPLQAKVVEGNSGLVAATMSPIAVRAGIEALRQGGTAADAAAAVALTQVTTALGSYVSYAGILQLVYYDAESGKVSSMNAGWNSYLGETDPRTIPVADLGSLPIGKKPSDGAQGRKTLVPGFMAGIQSMHRRFGRLPFSDLFAPAIWYADNGVTITPLLDAYFKMRETTLSRTAEGRAFLNQAGSPLPKTGDRFVQASLASTLRAVAANGAETMYSGPWGQHFVAAAQSEGGKATMEDMKRYQPIWEEPLSTTYLGHTIFAPGRSNDGAYQVLEALNLAEELKLDRMGSYAKDPNAFQALSRILSDVEFDSLAIPQVQDYKRQNGLSLLRDDRISKPYAKRVAALMAFHGQAPQASPSPHTDAVVVIDRWGSIAALSHSINTVVWGSTGIVVDGIPIPDAAGFQQARLAAIKPGDPVPQDMAPVIVMSGTQPVLAIASVGSSLIPETVRLIVGTLANHLDPLTAMAAPPLLLNMEPPKAGETFFTRPEIIPQGAYEPEFIERLKQSGMDVEQKSQTEVYGIKGTAVLGTFDTHSHVLRSIESPNVFGFASAY